MKLKPEYHKEGKDHCYIKFMKDHIEISPTIDSTGNAFKLRYIDVLIGMGVKDGKSD